MKNLNSRKIRSMFMLGGVAAMMGATMMVPQAAHADEAKNYKYGATALGILGAIFAVKGKALPAVIAGAAGYYAYKKGADIQEDNRYDDQYDNRYNGSYQNDNNRYGNNDSNGYYGDRYDTNNRYDQNNNRYDQNNNRYDRNDNRYDSNDSRNNSNNNNYGNRYDNNNQNNSNDYRNNNYNNNRPYSVR